VETKDSEKKSATFQHRLHGAPSVVRSAQNASDEKDSEGEEEKIQKEEHRAYWAAQLRSGIVFTDVSASVMRKKRAAGRRARFIVRKADATRRNEGFRTGGMGTALLVGEEMLRSKRDHGKEALGGR
jgi:hypothetical protein